MLSFLLAISLTVLSQVIAPSDELARWNFVPANVTVNGSTTTVKDESGSGFTGTVMNNASIRTIGTTTKYNVLDLGNGTGYFDMGTGIGEAIYSLSNYTMSAFFRVNANNTDLSRTGNCLWNFSNSTNASTDKNGYIFSSLRNQSQHITTGYWASGEQVVGKENYNVATPSKDVWHHLAYTQNGTTGTIYIDGVQAATASITNLPSVVLPKTGFTGTPFNWIGRSCYSGDTYLKQTMVYGFSLYRVALTAANMTNYLNVPTIISDLNNSYAQDSGLSTANLLPFSAGIITGGVFVEQGMNSIPYTVPPIPNASSYIWTLPDGATGTSSTNSILVNFTNTAVSGNITVKGHNDLGDGAASSLAITVNQSSVELTDTALNCVDNLILSAYTAIPVKMTFDTRGWGPEDIELILIDQLSNRQVSHFTKHVTEYCDTTLYLKTGKYIIKNMGPDSINGSPNLLVSGENVYSAGWISNNNIETHFEFKVIVKTLVCGGQSLLYANTHYTGPGKLKYKWTPSTGLDNDSILNPTATVTNNTTYTVVATSPNGCTATVHVFVAVGPLTVNAGNDKSIVCGGTTQLSNVTTNYAGTGILKYKWTPSTGLNNDTIANPTAIVIGNMTYCVTVTSPGGCTASDTVKVLSTPLTANAGTDKTMICGGNEQLSNITTNYTGTGKLRYKWTPSTGLNNDTLANPTANVIGNMTYYVTVTSPGGCSASDTVKVLSTPLSANAGTDKTMVCGGNEQLSNITTNYTGTGKLRYKWTPSTGLNNDTIANPTVNAIGNMTYHVTVTSPNGCIAEDSVKVSMIALSANAGTDKTIVCGGTAQLSNVITNYTGTGKLKYKWTPSNGLNNDTIVNPSSNINANITYTVTVTTPGGCSATDDIKVSVTALNITQLRDTAVDGGGNVPIFVFTNYTGNGALKYKWTPSTGLDNDSIANPVCSTFKNMNYSVTVSSPNGCTATGNVNVTVRSMAKPVIGIVSVSTSNKNMVVWNKPVSTSIESYYVYRETTVSNVYEKIGIVPYDSLSVFVDNQSAPNVKSNKYKLSIFDRNGQESALSDAHKTMHLTINKGQNNTWNLIWEAYEGFNVSTYNIYRGTAANALSFVDATSGSSTQYSDLSVPAGDVYYQMEVISPNLVSPSKAPASIQKSKNSGNSTASSLVSYNSSRSNVATNVVSGISEFGTENCSIKLYPNPVLNELRIEYDGETSFEIVNLMGQVVLNGNLNKSTIVQTSILSSGVYMIKVRTGNSFEYRKIIKE